MLKNKSSKKLKTSLLKSILIFGILISPFAFAENPLVTQAKELQTGSEKVGMDHQKAITLLKKASDEGDAEAMYLLSEYYSSLTDYRYLPENRKLYDQLRLKSAQAGHWEAINNLVDQANVEKDFGIQSKFIKELEKLKQVVKKGIQQKQPAAFISMVNFLESPHSSTFNLEQCDLLYQAYLLGSILEAGHRLKYCNDDDLTELKLPSRADFIQKYNQNLAKDVKAFKAISAPTFQQKNELLSHFSPWDLDEQFIKISENLTQQVNNFYVQQGQKGFSDAYVRLAIDETDSKKEQAWYQKAAALKNPIALTALANTLLYGEDQNQKKIAQGIVYMEQAIAQNYPEAMNMLAVWYVNERHTAQNQQKAEALLLSATKLGSIDAMENLSRILDTPERHRWAVSAYNNGSEEDDVLALAQEAYAEGITVKKDAKLVKQLAKILAEKQEKAEAVDEALGLSETSETSE